MKKDERIPVAVLADKSRNWKKKLANWVRLNLFVPDAKIGWIPFAVNKGREIIKKEKPDIIFSSSPPPTVHIIAMKLAKWSGIKWVADFRDPWTEIHYYENQERTKISQKLDSKYEREILKSASVITTISQLYIEEDFAKKVSSKKCINIPNGYDENDFSNFGHKRTQKDTKKFVIMHLGAVGQERNPTNFFKAIKSLADSGKINAENFSLVFIGKVDSSVKTSIEEYKISELVDIISYLPHKEALEYTQEASIMLLLVTQSERNRRILPGKTFEYMRTGKPILALGPEDGELARIITESNTGIVISYDNFEKIYNSLLSFYSLWEKGMLKKYGLTNKILVYSRKNLTKKLVSVFEDIC
jgi:glycosyltransferase involved in cell wall biosynthesis